MVSLPQVIIDKIISENDTTDGVTPVTIATYDISTAKPGGGTLTNCTVQATATMVGISPIDDTGASDQLISLFSIDGDGYLFQAVSGSSRGIMSNIPTPSDAPFGQFEDPGGISSLITFDIVGITGTTINWYVILDIIIIQALPA